MKKTKNISLYLISNIILTGCEEQPKNSYTSLDLCEKDHSADLCQLAFIKALAKDRARQPTSREECYHQYRSCQERGAGFVPIMQGFTVILPDDGDPWYRKYTRRLRWTGGLGGWGSKPRSGGFGSFGSHGGG